MKHQRTIHRLIIGITALALIAASMGIFSNDGPGNYLYETIRGETVTIYGIGIYSDMTADVAIQGIAQDFVTLLIAIPLLLISLYFAEKGSMRARYLLTGTLGYFLVTYLFYTAMGMYNSLFLVYVALLGLSFFAFTLSIFSFEGEGIMAHFKGKFPNNLIGGFLIFSAVAIALMWLQVIVPPLLSSSVPESLDHYTTLIVQGLDLGLLLPIAFVAGVMILKRQRLGYILAPVFLVFLTILMTALTAKIIAMSIAGVSVIPAVFIIPVFNLVSLAVTILFLHNIKAEVKEKPVLSKRVMPIGGFLR